MITLTVYQQACCRRNLSNCVILFYRT